MYVVLRRHYWVLMVILSLSKLHASSAAPSSLLKEEAEFYNEKAVSGNNATEAIREAATLTKYFSQMEIAPKVEAAIAQVTTSADSYIVMLSMNINASIYTCDIFFQPTNESIAFWNHRSVLIDFDGKSVELSYERGLPMGVMGEVPTKMKATQGVYVPYSRIDSTFLTAVYRTSGGATHRCASFGVPVINDMTIAGRIGTLAWVLIGIEAQFSSRGDSAVERGTSR